MFLYGCLACRGGVCAAHRGPFELSFDDEQNKYRIRCYQSWSASLSRAHMYSIQYVVQKAVQKQMVNDLRMRLDFYAGPVPIGVTRTGGKQKSMKWCSQYHIRTVCHHHVFLFGSFIPRICVSLRRLHKARHTVLCIPAAVYKYYNVRCPPFAGPPSVDSCQSNLFCETS